MGFSPYSASNFAVVNMSEGLAVSSSRLALALLVSNVLRPGFETPG